MTGEGTIELEKENSPYTETLLVDICYQSKYPLIHALLKDVLRWQQDSNHGKEALTPHPLFELIFYHADVIEFCLKNVNFCKIFSSEQVLFLLQQDLLSAFDLFDALTTNSGKITEVDKGICNLVALNLAAMKTYLTTLQERKVSIQQDELMNLLHSSKTQAFFKNESLMELLLKGCIPFNKIDKIIPYQLDSQFAILSEQEKIKFLEENFYANQVCSNEFDVSSSSDDDSMMDGLFSIPEVQVQDFPKQKPAVNIGLLIRSMSDSVLSQPEYEEEEVREGAGCLLSTDSKTLV